MAWDQVASSAQVARTYTYRLFIDGVLSAMTDIRCNDTRTSAGYECSGLLPNMPAGQHTLEVAAVAGALQSASSVPLLVQVGIGSTTATQTSSTGAGFYDARLVATGLTAVTDLTWVPGERAFFIEDGERIREIRADALTQQPALDRESSNARFISLTAAPDFDRTHVLFVGWSEVADAGREAFHVTRYREVDGRLGEGATIVTGLPIPANAHVPIGVDNQGLLYVALPAPASNGGPTDGSGSLLRFDSDGAVPSTNPLSSPVVASSYSTPSALAWDKSNRQMWLAGADAHLNSSVLTLPISTDGQVGQLTDPALAYPDRMTDAVSLPAIAIGAAVRGESRLWVVQEPGSVYRGSAPVRTVLTRIRMDGMGTAQTIVESPTGGLWVVTGPTGSRGQTSVWRVVPTDPSLAVQ
jgi:hypothetical protein